jgi:Peptidase family M23
MVEAGPPDLPPRNRSFLPSPVGRFTISVKMSTADTMRRAIYFAAAFYSIFPLLILWYVLSEPPWAPGFPLGWLAMLYLLLTGRWDLVSYPLRFVFLAFLTAVVYYRAGWWAAVLVLATLAVFSSLLRHINGEAIELEFPIRGGVYYIVHGGSAGLLNAHHVSDSQRFALDVVALNVLGARAKGIYPHRLRDYQIFARAVHSPCSGTVTATSDGLPDMPPAQPDHQHPAGNHIVIRRDQSDISIGFAHLMQGSVSVRPGDRVETGQFLARVGNSGNSSEPHLHLHAKRGGDSQSMLDGAGVPMRLGGRWLIRNSLVGKF